MVEAGPSKPEAARPVLFLATSAGINRVVDVVVVVVLLLDVVAVCC